MSEDEINALKTQIKNLEERLLMVGNVTVRERSDGVVCIKTFNAIEGHSEGFLDKESAKALGEILIGLE